MALLWYCFDFEIDAGSFGCLWLDKVFRCFTYGFSCCNYGLDM